VHGEIGASVEQRQLDFADENTLRADVGKPRRAGAIAGMLVGSGFTAAYIAGNRSDMIFGTDEPLMGPWCFGISAEGIGAVGCLLNLAVAIVVSRLTPPPSAQVQALVRSIRLPRGSHDPEARFDERAAEAS